MAFRYCSLATFGIFRYFVCNYILCVNEDIALSLNGSQFGRHLGFWTLRMWRKNGTLIFLKVMTYSFKITWVFAFTKKYTRIFILWQMSLHYEQNSRFCVSQSFTLQSGLCSTSYLSCTAVSVLSILRYLLHKQYERYLCAHAAY